MLVELWKKAPQLLSWFVGIIKIVLLIVWTEKLGDMLVLVVEAISIHKVMRI